MSSDERFPYSRRAIVGVGGISLVAAAAPAFAQSSKDAAPLEAKRDADLPRDCKIRAASIPSRRFADRSSLGRDSQAEWIRARTTARRPIAGQVGSPAGRLW